ncbi:hypothetical protein [Novosphingobium beihaiensis]|uniref:Mobilization protein n=1 Tax=Novosphingobium beihaiensis TaxID=2930389 RepID=A0ABT0BSW0_9SPHN|nr:hypothetical protein [Novosphingobium beihaiensis]MCJ2187876.1 hypothetical protein [Novosphingobium beihaiensis]
MGTRLTIRLDDTERTVLERRAGNRPLAAYAREKLLGNDTRKRAPSRRPKADTVMLAHILAALGSSDLPSNMREIAEAARIGALPESEDVLLNLRAACLAIEKMRFDLIKALDVKPE